MLLKSEVDVQLRKREATSVSKRSCVSLNQIYHTKGHAEHPQNTCTQLI